MASLFDCHALDWSSFLKYHLEGIFDVTSLQGCADSNLAGAMVEAYHSLIWLNIQV